jgi:GT2 family glycosyltransferase
MVATDAPVSAVMLRSAVRRARSAIARPRPVSPTDRWTSFLSEVEPALAAQVRVHRFAQPPLLGKSTRPTVPVAVWIDDGDEAALARTRAALDDGTVAPAAVLAGPLGDALAESRVEQVLIVRAGDRPAPLALERLGQAAALAPDAVVITCDDDEMANGEIRSSPRFRPGPSPDRWLACDDSGPMLLVSREAALAALAGRANVHGSGAWRHEVALTLAGVGSEQHAHVPLLLCHRAPGWKEPTSPAEAVAHVLAAWEPAARLESDGEVRRVRRPLIGEPSVEIIVCLRDQAELTRLCVESILTRTRYEHFAVTLVDNGSVQPETGAMLADLAVDSRVRLRRDNRPFNFAALNNAAASDTEADMLVFLNNDTELIDDDWLVPLLEEAQRPQVGAVAPMLLFDDGTVQHAGAALGMHGYAGHPFAGLDARADTPFGRADGGTRNWLAVSAACVMVKRSAFEAIGGFDERFVVAGNDVDLCLRLTTAGQRSLCVPHVRLFHHESRSRGVHIDPGDFAASQRSYGAFRTVGDPFYNPNLTLRGTDCAVRMAGEGAA